MWYDADLYQDRFVDEMEQDDANEPAGRATVEDLQAELAAAEAALLTATGNRADMWREEIRTLRALIASRSRMAA